MKKFGRTLIGHTGFVGTSLRTQQTFDGLFNRANIAEARDTLSELLVCSAAPAQKWLANSNPDQDLENIRNLIFNLKKIHAKRAVLISTVDVFSTPIGVDEDSPSVPDLANAYGGNRRYLEVEFSKIFENALIVRLPGLVGQGLRKNALFDLKTNNDVAKLNGESVFQFYPMSNLWTDITLAASSHLPLVHLTSQPISLGEIAETVFQTHLPSLPSSIHYDFRTRHSGLWNQQGHYQYSKSDSMRAIEEFAKR